MRVTKRSKTHQENLNKKTAAHRAEAVKTEKEIRILCTLSVNVPSEKSYAVFTAVLLIFVCSRSFAPLALRRARTLVFHGLAPFPFSHCLTAVCFSSSAPVSSLLGPLLFLHHRSIVLLLFSHFSPCLVRADFPAVSQQHFRLPLPTALLFPNFPCARRSSCCVTAHFPCLCYCLFSPLALRPSPSPAAPQQYNPSSSSRVSCVPSPYAGPVVPLHHRSIIFYTPALALLDFP